MGPYLQIAARHLHEGHQGEHGGGFGPAGPLSQLRRKAAAPAAAVACSFTVEGTIMCIRHVLQMGQHSVSLHSKEAAKSAGSQQGKHLVLPGSSKGEAYLS